MSPSMNADERLLQLLSDKSTVGISDEEQRELDRLLAESGLTDEPDRFEVAAAAMDLASTPHDLHCELPPELRDKILAKASHFFREADSSEPTGRSPVVSPGIESITHSQSKSVESPRPSNFTNASSSPKVRLREVLAYIVAASALVMGFWLWSNPSTPSLPTAQVLKTGDIESAPDFVKVDWVNVHGENIQGEVGWSDQLQQGFMVFENLPANDPSVEQYQLWIFDKDVTQAVPTDGGVFDIENNEGVSTVFFKPTHPVKKGVQFAVTIETPGGVQKSSRERLPVLGTIPGSTPPPASAKEVEEDDSV